MVTDSEAGLCEAIILHTTVSSNKSIGQYVKSYFCFGNSLLVFHACQSELIQAQLLSNLHIKCNVPKQIVRKLKGHSTDYNTMLRLSPSD